MTSRELSEWMAYAAIEPFGCPIEDERAGLIAAVLCNIHAGRGTPPVHPGDFFRRESEEERATREANELSERLMNAMRSFG